MVLAPGTVVLVEVVDGSVVLVEVGLVEVDGAAVGPELEHPLETSSAATTAGSRRR